MWVFHFKASKKIKKKSSKTPCRIEKLLVFENSQEPFIFVDTERGWKELLNLSDSIETYHTTSQTLYQKVVIFVNC